MAETIRFTKKRLEEVACPPDKSEHVICDEVQQGLLLRVRSTGHKSFQIRRRLKGRYKRVTLGTFPDTTIDQARKKALKELSRISEGVDPIAHRRAERDKGATLNECLKAYLNSRTNLKKSTVSGYVNTLKQYLPDWLDKPLKDITRDMVEKRHREIGQISPTRANTVMRVLRALFTYAHGKYEDEFGSPVILHNPVSRLNHAKAWYKEKRRTTFIEPSDMKAWFDTVNAIPDWLHDPRVPTKVWRDFLLLVLFTGLRRREASSLRVQDVDLIAKTLSIPGDRTKNSEDHVLPISSFVESIIVNRVVADEIYIFPSLDGGHIKEPKRMIEKVRTKSGVYFTVHDLRRTFATTAESVGVRGYTLKRLLNHKTGDVTEGYLTTSVDMLREPMQRITDQLLRQGQGDVSIASLVHFNSASRYLA